jgi:hypothetical protein
MGVFKQIEAYGSQACALRQDGSVACWGGSFDTGVYTVPTGIACWGGTTRNLTLADFE